MTPRHIVTVVVALMGVLALWMIWGGGRSVETGEVAVCPCGDAEEITEWLDGDCRYGSAQMRVASGEMMVAERVKDSENGMVAGLAPIPWPGSVVGTCYSRRDNTAYPVRRAAEYAACQEAIAMAVTGRCAGL
jgi:hypothetical protein